MMRKELISFDKKELAGSVSPARSRVQLVSKNAIKYPQKSEITHEL